MKPPRFLLREAMLLRILEQFPAGTFLEIGYGSGNTLVTLAKRGFRGDGYDFSPEARDKADKLLAAQGIANVSLLSGLEHAGSYDYLFFFEVIGYWQDPVEELARLQHHMAENGKMIFSFTNKRVAGYAEEATGQMRCFSRQEVIAMIEHLPGLEIERIWNYGFPLANLMKPCLDLLHYLKSGRAGSGQDHGERVKRSGFATDSFAVRLASLVINRVTIYPFAKFQYLFRSTDLGTGYLVVVKKR